MSLSETNRLLSELESERDDALRLRDQAAREVADLAANGATETAEFTSAVAFYRKLAGEAADVQATYDAALHSGV